MKKCRICEEILQEENFYKIKQNKKATKEYFYNECKSCRHARDNIRISSTPERYLKQTYKALKYNRTKGLTNKHYDFDITEQDLIDQWYKQDGICALSGIELTHLKDGKGKKWMNATVDRINPVIGYTATNIQLVCHRANLIKHDMDEENLMFWIEAINEHKQLKGLLQQWS